MLPFQAPRRALDWVLALAILAIPAALVTATWRSGGVDAGKRSGFDKVVLRVASPLQAAVAWVIDGVAGVWHDYVWLVDVKEENDELRQENDRLRRSLADATRQAREASELEALVDLRRRTAAETLPARVVASSTNPQFRVLKIVIDRGEGEVVHGMPVLAAEGVVGRIETVVGRYADVTLAVDPQSSIDVIVPRTGSRGVLKGLGAENAYSCRIEYLQKGEAVQEDDVVVTSGLGSVFPREIPVGRIRKISAAEYGLYQKVEVEPAVDFSRLRSVVVLLAPPPPPDPSARQKKSPEQAFGTGPYR
jgi:rod shape-determining protein MreC